MTAITILNLFLLPCLIVLLILGVVLNYKYIEKNVYQRYLITMLLFWALIMIFVYAKFFVDGFSTISYVRDVCSVQVLLLGISCFFSLISYPVVILNARFLTVKRWCDALLPIITAIAIYFAYHILTHTDPFVKYPTFRALLADIGSPSVILRLALCVAFAYYTIRDLRRIWRVVPLYNQYVQDNIADSGCNVGWIRQFVVYISAVMCSYALLLFFSTPLVNSIYLISLILLFFYIVEMSLLHYTSERIECLEIFRDAENPKGYVFVEKGTRVAPEELCCVECKPTFTIDHIDSWMKANSPYTSVDFTTADILEAFPSFTQQELTDMFRSRGETFQSYVRRFRIVKACELIDNAKNGSYSKQIFSMVGFSHHSSFSRSFVSVVGVSPSDYMKLSKDQKRRIMSQRALGEQFTPPPPMRRRNS